MFRDWEWMCALVVNIKRVIAHQYRDCCFFNLSFFSIFSWTNCNEIPHWDTASNYDILYNPLQVPHAGASSWIDVNNLYRISASKESAARELNTLLCVAQKKLSQVLWVLSFSLIWAGQQLLEQTLVHLWSPVKKFRKYFLQSSLNYFDFFNKDQYWFELTWGC